MFVKNKVLKKEEYVYEDISLKDEVEEFSFEKKIKQAQVINDIFDNIKDHFFVISNYGNKLQTIKEEFVKKGLVK